MKLITKYFSNRRVVTLPGIGLALLLVCGLSASGQQKMPRPIAVFSNPGDGLRFGTFFQSSPGGTVVISTSGVRTCTGSVIGATIGTTYGAANFDIDAEPGTLINIVNGPDAILYGSSGGTMTLHIGSSYPAGPFVTTVTSPVQTSVKIGGTLTVGSAGANPSGTYSGSFTVTFIQE